MSGWDALVAELDAWQASGRTASLWWRDDDAVASTPALARMLAIASHHEVPLALAVIPAALERSLVAIVAQRTDCSVLQHGYAHRNHAASGERARELGGARPFTTIADELVQGSAVLRDSFGDRLVEAIVPPWNRIDRAVVERLPALGFAGLSTFGPRTASAPVSGLAQCNTHVDPIAWRTGRMFIGADACVQRLVEHLAARREGRVDATEPTGLLTHHLVFGDDAWAFVARLCALTRAHPAAMWLAASVLFPGATSGRST